MSPRSRTLCIVLLSLSLNNGFVASVPVGPVLPEYFPCLSHPQPVNSLLTVQDPHTAFPSQRFNDVFSFGSYPPGLSINTVATTNCGVPKSNSFNTYSTYCPIEPPSPLPIVEPITETLPYSSNVEPIEENYLPVTQTIQVEGFPPTANVAEIYQAPITVQIPSPPAVTPFIAVASPLPEISPSQNVIEEIYTETVVPETRLVETEIAKVTSVPVETTTSNMPSYVPECGTQPMPVTLQINLAHPSCNPEPVLYVVPQPTPAPSPYSSFNPSFEMPQAPPPIIVMENSKSSLKSILPILVLALFDGGCGNNGGGGCSCSQCSCGTPIPFPILIPTNNPVICRGRRKGKTSTVAQS